MTNVWVLGSNGMLGTAVNAELLRRSIKSAAITRTSFGSYQLGSSQDSDIEAIRNLEKLFGTPTHIINAVGVVKPRIDETNSESVLQAIQGNTIFPRSLGRYCESKSVHLIQIATDCVFSGTKGEYLESDLHDPTDVYGKTKSLGEFSGDHISLIRCSIIGRENANKYSLVEWVNSQPPQASVNGFINHNWNGVTTKVFGMIASGIIQDNLNPVGKIHLIPKDKLNKLELVNLIKNELGRKDIDVKDFEASIVIDRTLSTELPDLNTLLWKSAGFKNTPSISEMVKLGL
jgi:dTDP-4-dehydrorhamnose reductase